MIISVYTRFDSQILDPVATARSFGRSGAGVAELPIAGREEAFQERPFARLGVQKPVVFGHEGGDRGSGRRNLLGDQISGLLLLDCKRGWIL